MPAKQYAENKRVRHYEVILIFFKDSVKEHILEWAGGLVAIGDC